MEGKRNLIQKLGDYAGVSSLLFGGLTASYLYGLKGTSDGQNEILPWVYPLGIFAGIYLAYDFLTTCRRLNEPVMKNYLFIAFNPEYLYIGSKSFKEKNEEDIKKLIKFSEKERKRFRFQSSIDLGLGSLYIQKREFETGISYFKKGFENISNQDFRMSILEKISVYLFKRQHKKLLNKNPNNIDHYFSLIDAGLRSGNLEESVNYWKKLCNLDLDKRIEFNVLFALFIEATKSTKINLNSEEQWKYTSELAIKKGKDLKKITDSRNAVLELGPTEFLKSTFVFKKNITKDDFKAMEDLKRDFEINKELYKLTEIDKEIKVARPLAFFEDINGYAFDVTQRKPLKNLEDVFENASDEQKTQMLKSALENERRIHKASKEKIKFEEGTHIENNGIYFGNVKLSNYDYRAQLKRRLLERVGVNNEGQDLIETILEELISPINRINDKRYNTLIHGDLALPNLLEDGTEIDFEKAAFGNPIIDVTTTLEDPKNNNVNRELLKDYYLNSYVSEEKELLNESYNIHSLFVSACQVGSKLSQSEKSKTNNELEKARKHIERSIGFQNQVLERSSPKVKDKFVKYIRSSDKKVLQQAL